MPWSDWSDCQRLTNSKTRCSRWQAGSNVSHT